MEGYKNFIKKLGSEINLVKMVLTNNEIEKELKMEMISELKPVADDDLKKEMMSLNM